MSNKRNVWYDYDYYLWSSQILPKERKPVLLKFEESDINYKYIVVGYLRYATGDKNSPNFIAPGACSKNKSKKIIAWNDCLPKNLKIG